jgi:hypothetical protein
MVHVELSLFDDVRQYSRDESNQNAAGRRELSGTVWQKIFCDSAGQSSGNKVTYQGNKQGNKVGREPGDGNS